MNNALHNDGDERSGQILRLRFLTCSVFSNLIMQHGRRLGDAEMHYAYTGVPILSRTAAIVSFSCFKYSFITEECTRCGRYLCEFQHLLYSGHLNDPAHVGRVDFMLNKPMREALPLLRRASVDREAGLGMLVFTLL